MDICIWDTVNNSSISLEKMTYIDLSHNDFIIIEKGTIRYKYSLTRYRLISIYNNHAQGLHLDYTKAIIFD